MRLWSKPETAVEQAVGWRDAVGFGVWSMAFIVEAVADYQKYSFYSNPENKVNNTKNSPFSPI
jgi:steroid 5-alpha reductase family enzyme